MNLLGDYEAKVYAEPLTAEAEQQLALEHKQAQGQGQKQQLARRIEFVGKLSGTFGPYMHKYVELEAIPNEARYGGINDLLGYGGISPGAALILWFGMCGRHRFDAPTIFPTLDDALLIAPCVADLNVLVEKEQKHKQAEQKSRNGDGMDVIKI